MKKKLSSAWLIVSLFVLPAILNLENGWCLVIIMANILGAILTFTRHNGEYFINHNNN